MTTIPLHGVPQWRTVASEQLRAVGLLTRKAGFVLIALIGVVLAVVIPLAIKSRSVGATRPRAGMLEVTFAPWILLASIVAALFAFAIWRDDEPSRRSYHWMMPVEPHVHTLTKVLAGWVWLLAGSALWMIAIAAIGALSASIAGQQPPTTIIPWWFGFAPLMSATIAYILVSAATVGTRQPVIWVVGIVVLYAATLVALKSLGYRDTYAVVSTAFNGDYGITAALAGDISRLDTEHLRMAPNARRWLGASALWGGLGAMLLVATAYRRAEPTLVGAHGPLRRAILGHTWLVASTIAISVAAGLVATRVMKPEYEAKATIWNEAEASKGVVMSVDLTKTEKTNDALAVVTSLRIVDTVVRRLALYVRPENLVDTSLLKDFAIGDRFMPGEYLLAVADSGIRWQLTLAENRFVSDSGVAGDSIGWAMGLRWRPEPATLARYAGREVSFTVATPKEAVANMLSRITIVQQANSSFLQLALTDPDPQRAARSLNALAGSYVSKVRDAKGAPLVVLDSAVAPAFPFKNSATQLFGVSLVTGIVVAIGLAFAMGAIEERTQRF